VLASCRPEQEARLTAIAVVKPAPAGVIHSAQGGRQDAGWGELGKLPVHQIQQAAGSGIGGILVQQVVDRSRNRSGLVPMAGDIQQYNLGDRAVLAGMQSVDISARPCPRGTCHED